MDAPRNTTDGNFAAGFMLAMPLSLAAWFGLCYLALQISTHIYGIFIAVAFATCIGVLAARFWSKR